MPSACRDSWAASSLRPILSTGSRDLAVRHAPQAAYGGGEADGFVAALSSDLSHLCFSTLNRRFGQGSPRSPRAMERRS